VSVERISRGKDREHTKNLVGLAEVEEKSILVHELTVLLCSVAAHDEERCRRSAGVSNSRWSHWMEIESEKLRLKCSVVPPNLKAHVMRGKCPTARAHVR